MPGEDPYLRKVMHKFWLVSLTSLILTTYFLTALAQRSEGCPPGQKNQCHEFKCTNKIDDFEVAQVYDFHDNGEHPTSERPWSVDFFLKLKNPLTVNGQPIYVIQIVFYPIDHLLPNCCGQPSEQEAYFENGHYYFIGKINAPHFKGDIDAAQNTDFTKSTMTIRFDPRYKNLEKKFYKITVTPKNHKP